MHIHFLVENSAKKMSFSGWMACQKHENQVLKKNKKLKNNNKIPFKKKKHKKLDSCAAITPDVEIMKYIPNKSQ